MAKLSISIPDDLYKQLEDAAKSKKETVSAFVADALLAYLPKDGTGSGTSGTSSGTSSGSSSGGSSGSPGGSSPVPSLQQIWNDLQETNQFVGRFSDCMKYAFHDLYALYIYLNGLSQNLIAAGLKVYGPPGTGDDAYPDGSPEAPWEEQSFRFLPKLSTISRKTSSSGDNARKKKGGKSASRRALKRGNKRR